MAPGEHLCKLNWGNSVSPAENQLAYGFKIKHTHNTSTGGEEGHGFGETEPRQPQISRARWKRGHEAAWTHVLLEDMIDFLSF